MAGIKNRGLGKGLEALFGEVEIKASHEQDSIESNESREHVRFLDINQIRPNTSQPRQYFNEEKINELAESIAAHGVIQPIIVKKSEQGYEIVAGERRWRAARRAGLKQVPAIPKELTEEQTMLFAIIENVQREDLNPIEEAEALEQMIAKFGLTQEQVSKGVGKSRPYITNALRLLKLPEEIRQMVLEGRLSNGHARALVSVVDFKRQLALAQRAAEEGLSVREIEKLVKESTEQKPKTKPKRLRDAQVTQVEQELKEVLGTKVTLRHKGRKGKIEIDYYSREELDRLIELLRGLRE